MTSYTLVINEGNGHHQVVNTEAPTYEQFTMSDLVVLRANNCVSGALESTILKNYYGPPDPRSGKFIDALMKTPGWIPPISIASATPKFIYNYYGGDGVRAPFRRLPDIDVDPEPLFESRSEARAFTPTSFRVVADQMFKKLSNRRQWVLADLTKTTAQKSAPSIGVPSGSNALLEHEYPTNPLVAKESASKCECGAASTGVAQRGAGHSSRCPWSKP